MESCLLRKSSDVKLPHNYFGALSRLQSIKKIDKETLYSKKYCAKIEEYVKQNYARKLTEDEIKKKNGKVWYLPHFGVTNVNKPGKLRFVFDVAAKYRGISLNDALVTGAVLLTYYWMCFFDFVETK